jgi:hypothetical protein
MKALSLWQPWATLIAIGAKRYETRSWQTTYRGPLVICASKTWRSECDYAVRHVPEIAKALKDASIQELPRGVAVCLVKLVDCQQTYRTIYTGQPIRWWAGKEEIADADLPFGDFSPGRFAWGLELIRRIEPPFPVRGYQGLFDLPDMPHFPDNTA